MLTRRPTAVNLFPRRNTSINLRRHGCVLALEQRLFGPRRLLLAFADRTGRLRGLSHCERTEPIEVALDACLRRHGRRAGVAAAVAYCDEEVTEAPPPDDLGERFARASALCASYGIHLVDWFAVDDIYLRSFRATLDSPGQWWNVP